MNNQKGLKLLKLTDSLPKWYNTDTIKGSKKERKKNEEVEKRGEG